MSNVALLPIADADDDPHADEVKVDEKTVRGDLAGEKSPRASKKTNQNNDRKSASEEKSPPVDPLRASLAVAISEAAKIRATVERQKAGIARTLSAVASAEAGLEKATANLAKTQQGHASAVAAAAAAGSGAPVSKIRGARQSLEDAQDELEAQKLALGQLEADLPDWQNNLREAEIEVEAAVSCVLAQQTLRMLARAEEIAAELAPLRAALAMLWSEPSPVNHSLALSHEKSRRGPLAEAKSAIATFLQATSTTGRCDPDPWAIARAGLRENAYAELVEIEGLLNG